MKFYHGLTYKGPHPSAPDWFIKKHLSAMTLEACTPWHDSEVFTTAHSAFNLEFEGSLRAINPSLSAHFWEITEDSTKYGENWASEVCSHRVLVLRVIIRATWVETLAGAER